MNKKILYAAVERQKRLCGAQNKCDIFMQVKGEEELFDSFDPSPARERSVRQDVESYLLGRLEKKSPARAVAVSLSVPRDFSCSDAHIRDAFKNHFSERADGALEKISKETARRTVDLIFGFFFLAACLVASHFFHINAEEHSFLKVLGESASIIGWVVIWEPAAYFLYQRRELVQEAFAYARLAAADINVRRAD